MPDQTFEHVCMCTTVEKRYLTYFEALKLVNVWFGKVGEKKKSNFKI